MDNKKIFSLEEVNTGRQIEFDLAKAFLMFWMPIVHVTIIMSSPEDLQEGFPYFVDSVVGGPLGAPVFIISMGFGITYSRKSTPYEFFRKGIGILIAGYILNYFAIIIPFYQAYRITGEQIFYDKIVFEFWGNNILQFAGLALILLALLLSFKLSNIVIGAIAVILLLISDFFYETDFGGTLENIFFGHFVGTQNTSEYVISDFSLFKWFIVFISGYFFGKVLIHVVNKTKLYARILIVTLPIAIFFLAYGIYNNVGMFWYTENSYYQAPSYQIILTIITNFAAFSIWYFISFILPNPIRRFAETCSRNILQFYCIHIFFVSVVCRVLLYALLDIRHLNSWQIFLVGTGIFIISILIANLYTTKIRPFIVRRVHEKKKN